MVEVLIMAEGWWIGRCRFHLAFVFCVGDLRGGEKESIDPDAVDGAFAILTGGRTHEEPGCGDQDEVGLDWGCWLGFEVGMSRGHGA